MGERKQAQSRSTSLGDGMGTQRMSSDDREGGDMLIILDARLIDAFLAMPRARCA